MWTCTCKYPSDDIILLFENEETRKRNKLFSVLWWLRSHLSLKINDCILGFVLTPVFLMINSPEKWLIFHGYLSTTSFLNFLPHAFTFDKLYPKFCPKTWPPFSVTCVLVIGEVERCPPHHPASVPGRMDVSMWRGVSMRLLTGKASQSGTALPSTGQRAAHSSPAQSSLADLIQKGCVDVQGWVDEKEGLRVKNRG